MIFSFDKIIIALFLIAFNFVQTFDNSDENYKKNDAIAAVSTVAKKVGELSRYQGFYKGSHPALMDNPNSYYPKFAYSKYMHPPPPPPPTDGSKPHDPLGKGRNPRDPEYEDYYENKINHLKKQSNLGLGLGIGLGVGIPVLIILLLGIFIFYRYRKNRNQGSRLSSSIASVIMNPYSAHMDKKDQSPIHCSDLWAMDRQNVIIDYENKLGSGAFCNVHKGTIKGPAPVRAVCPSLIAVQRFTDCEVAIKLLPPFADDIARSDFAQV
uniref:Uncharacterized protein n=1 Tax=Panagrolaimus sp. ES5 TaxID=591445 RepID=A0AC34F7D8_9BILA